MGCTSGRLRVALVVAQVLLVVPACESRSSSEAALPASSGSAESHFLEGHGDSDPDGSRAEALRHTAATTALGSADRDKLTMLRVSARVGAVTLRKRGADWITAGAKGCMVPRDRIERALDDLTRLKASASGEPVPEGSAFELQIDALIGDRHVLHFEIAGRNDDGDLVRLLDDSTVRVKGLERRLWSPDPTLWCGDL